MQGHVELNEPSYALQGLLLLVARCTQEDCEARVAWTRWPRDAFERRRMISNERHEDLSCTGIYFMMVRPSEFTHMDIRFDIEGISFLPSGYAPTAFTHFSAKSSKDPFLPSI